MKNQPWTDISARNEGRSRQTKERLSLAELSGSLAGDLSDAYSQVLTGRFSEGVVVGALNTHLSVLNSRAAIVGAAKSIEDTERLTIVVSGLDLLQRLGPWTPELVRDLHTSLVAKKEENPRELAVYVHWLAEDDPATSLPNAIIAELAALQISRGLVAELSDSDEPIRW